MVKNNSFWGPVKPSKSLKPAKLFGFEMNPKPNKAYYIKQPRVPITPINFKVPNNISPLAAPFHSVKLNKINRVSPIKNFSIYPTRTKTEIKLITKNPWGDRDKDGVPNYFDCRPMNKKKQDAIIKFPSGRFMRFVSKSDIPATLKDTKIETPEQFRDVEEQINKISATKMKTEPGKRSTNPLYQKPVEMALDKGYETIRAHPVVNEMGHKMILKGRLNQDVLSRLNQQRDVHAQIAPDAESTIILVNQTGKSQKEVEDYMTKVIDVIPRKKMGEGGYLPSNVSLKGFKTVDGFVDLTAPQMAPDETISKNEMDLLLRPKMVGVIEEERLGKESTSPSVSMMVPEKTQEDIELDKYLSAHPEIKSPEEYRNKKRGRKKGSTLDKTLIYRVITPTPKAPEPEQPKRGRGRPRKAVSISLPTESIGTSAIKRGRGRPKREDSTPMYTTIISPPTSPTLSRGRGRPKKEESILREQAEIKLRKQEEQNIQNILDIFQKASPKERKIIETKIEEFKSKFPRGTGGYDREKKEFENIKKGKEKQKKLSERLKDVWQNRKEIFGTRKVGKTEKIPLKEIKEILEQEREINIKKQFGKRGFMKDKRGAIFFGDTDKNSAEDIIDEIKKEDIRLTEEAQSKKDWIEDYAKTKKQVMNQSISQSLKNISNKNTWGKKAMANPLIMKDISKRFFGEEKYAGFGKEGKTEIKKQRSVEESYPEMIRPDINKVIDQMREQLPPEMRNDKDLHIDFPTKKAAEGTGLNVGQVRSARELTLNVYPNRTKDRIEINDPQGKKLTSRDIVKAIAKYPEMLPGYVNKWERANEQDELMTTNVVTKHTQFQPNMHIKENIPRMVLHERGHEAMHGKYFDTKPEEFAGIEVDSIVNPSEQKMQQIKTGWKRLQGTGLEKNEKEAADYAARIIREHRQKEAKPEVLMAQDLIDEVKEEKGWGKEGVLGGGRRRRKRILPIKREKKEIGRLIDTEVVHIAKGDTPEDWRKRKNIEKEKQYRKEAEKIHQEVIDEPYSEGKPTESYSAQDLIDISEKELKEKRKEEAAVDAEIKEKFGERESEPVYEEHEKSAQELIDEA